MNNIWTKIIFRSFYYYEYEYSMQNYKSCCNDTYINVWCVKHLFKNSVTERLLELLFQTRWRNHVEFQVSAHVELQNVKCIMSRYEFTSVQIQNMTQNYIKGWWCTVIFTLQFGKLLMKNNFVFQLNLMLVTRQLEDNGENINDDDEDIISRLPDCCWAGSSLARQAVVWWQWWWCGKGQVVVLKQTISGAICISREDIKALSFQSTSPALFCWFVLKKYCFFTTPSL